MARIANVACQSIYTLLAGRRVNQYLLAITNVVQTTRQVPILCSMLQCSKGFTRLLAAMVPDAATAGRPMPGNVQSLRMHGSMLANDVEQILAALSMARLILTRQQAAH